MDIIDVLNKELTEVFTTEAYEEVLIVKIEPQITYIALEASLVNVDKVLLLSM